MHNIVSLNDLVTELTERISHLTLSQSETQAEARKRQLDMEDLQRELSRVKEELETLKEPRDGEWAEFEDWSDCSAECGGGTQTRTRTCTNPAPANGGEYCEGPGYETRICSAEPCPVNGGWTSWYSGTCSVPCGGDGTETRTRTCTNPAPAHGGADCSGTETDTRTCNNGICTNIARQGTATQTDDWGGIAYARYAIDGITNGDWARRSLSITQTQGQGAWWKLTFSNPVYIDAIEVYQRTDCCTYQSEGTVYIDDRLIGSLRSGSSNPSRISPIRKIGTKVTVRAIRYHLTLAEVLVYGAVIEE